MMDYKIVIPSLSRVDILKERTLNMLDTITKSNIYIFIIGDEYDEYKKALPDYNIIIGPLGCAEQKRYISNYFEEGDKLLFLDDDIKGFYKKNGSYLKPIEPQVLFDHTFEMMDRYKAHLCGLYPAKNPFFMRMKMRKGLSFSIGQFQAVINHQHIYDTFEYRILEDYERSMRYFLDYKTIRLDYITIDADYNKLDGGWQSSSQKRHVELKEAELIRFQKQYSDYCYIKQKKQGRDIVFKSIYSKELKTVQMLWIDKGKNELFKLAIQSWIHHGYSVDLYTDNPTVVDIPGVNPIPYTDILDVDTDEILQFADLFRYKLLYEKGGLWADGDCVMVNDYNFATEKIIISSEHTFKSGAYKSKLDYKPNIGFLKFPPKDLFLKDLIDTIESTIVNPDDPNQFMKIFQKKLQSKAFSYLNKYVKEPIRFCPVPWWVAHEMYKDIGVFSVKYAVMAPTVSMALEQSTTIHMWNNFSYNKHKIDFEKAHPQSLYGILKKRFHHET